MNNLFLNTIHRRWSVHIRMLCLLVLLGASSSAWSQTSTDTGVNQGGCGNDDSCSDNGVAACVDGVWLCTCDCGWTGSVCNLLSGETNCGVDAAPATGGTCYASLGNGGPLLTIDLATGLAAEVGGDTQGTALAVNSAGKLFAARNRDLYAVDAVTGESTKILIYAGFGPPGKQTKALVFDENDPDLLYGAAGAPYDGGIFSYDLSTGVTTVLPGDTPPISGMDIDPTDGTLYGSTQDNGGALVVIDRITGAASKIVPFTGENLPSGGARPAAIAFDADGNLYGSIYKDPYTFYLASIDKVTSTFTPLDDLGYPSVTGMACFYDAAPAVCGEDEFAYFGSCEVCPAGTTNEAGDDPSGADTSCDAAPLVLMDAKSEVVPVLLGLLPTGDSKTDNRINKAISSIYKSLDPGFWADGNHLTSDGKKVFDEEKKAVKELMNIKAALAEVDDAIVALVAIDAGLAQIALDEATAGGGDPSYIAKAENEMVKADDEIANDKFDKAIDHFKKAWENALKAQG